MIFSEARDGPGGRHGEPDAGQEALVISRAPAKSAARQKQPTQSCPLADTRALRHSRIVAAAVCESEGGESARPQAPAGREQRARRRLVLPLGNKARNTDQLTGAKAALANQGKNRDGPTPVRFFRGRRDASREAVGFRRLK